MTDCSRDSNPPELLEEVENSACDWMLMQTGDVQTVVHGPGLQPFFKMGLARCICPLHLAGGARGVTGFDGRGAHG